MNRRSLIGILAFVLAVVGAALLSIYVRSADERALAKLETRPVLVVVTEIPEGTPASALRSYVKIENVPGVAVVDGAAQRLTEIPDDHIAETTLQVGEQILPARFVSPESAEVTAAVPIPEHLQLLSVQLSPQRVVGGRLAAGDSVGVFVSVTVVPVEGTSAETDTAIEMTNLIANDVLVARVQGVPAAETTGETPTRETSLPGSDVIVTLAVDAPLAERLVFAQEFGNIWLSQQQPTTDPAGSLIVHAGNLFE